MTSFTFAFSVLAGILKPLSRISVGACRRGESERRQQGSRGTLGVSRFFMPVGS